MDAADLANDEVKSARAAIAERAEAKRKSVGSEATSLTRSVRCPECGCKGGEIFAFWRRRTRLARPQE